MRDTKHKTVARFLKAMKDAQYCYDELYEFFTWIYKREDLENADILSTIDRLYTEVNTLLDFMEQNVRY